MDKRLVNYIAQGLLNIGVEPYLAEGDPRPGVPLSSKVSQMIDASDCVVVILTATASKSHWVQQEIGYAIKAGKLILPFVERGVNAAAFLQGLEYVEVDPADPNSYQVGCSSLQKYVLHLKSQKEKNENIGKVVLGLLGAFTLGAILNSSHHDEDEEDFL